MKFQQAFIPLPLLWSSPFVRWQGSLADVSSLDLAAAVTGDALTDRRVDRAAIDRIVLGMTIPQANSFYGAPWLASRLGLPGVSGPLVAQACATSVACLAAACAEVEADAEALPLVVTTDRTSNGPLLVYPRSQGMGGSPMTEHWVLDSFAADPNTGQAMVATAEKVARDGAMSRAALDELVARWRSEARPTDDDALRVALAVKRGRLSKFEPCLPEPLLRALAARTTLDVGGARAALTQTEGTDGRGAAPT